MWFLLLVCLVTVLGVAVGGFPHVSVLAWSTQVALDWTIRNVVFAFVGGVAVLTLCFWQRPGARRVSPGWLALFGLLGAGCVYLPFLFPQQPLMWLPLVPALWVGMTLNPWWAALYSVGAALVTAVIGLGPLPSFGYDGYIGASLLVDLLLVFGTLVAMLLALYRDQRAQLVWALRREQQTAQAHSDLLTNTLDLMTEGVVLLGPDGQVVLYNMAARGLLGQPIPARPGDTWTGQFSLQTVDGRREFGDEQALLTPGNEVATAEFRLHPHPDEPPRIVRASSRSVAGADGSRLLVLLQDVTAEHTRHRQLETFAGTVAHDLKGPLTAVSGWLEAADDELADDDPVAGRIALVRAREAGQRMRQLIDDYIAYAVTRDGYLRPVEVSLSEVVREVIELIGVGGSGPAPRFEVAVPHTVRADRTLTRQLMANLVGNAVKYARTGEPAYVTVTSQPDDEPGWVRVEVADRGVGLHPGDEERIFAPFSRGEKDADSFQGTGLGLALCRSIVTRHGSSISAHRNEHAGTTIRFTLPAA